MKSEKEIILSNDPSIVEYKSVEGWVGKDGRFYGQDEHLARYVNSTHHVCECGGIASKSYTVCDSCIAKKDNERFLNMPFKEWDGETPLVIFRDDTYFFNKDEIADYCNDNEITGEGLQLVICEPNEYGGIPADYWEDILPENGELPDELMAKINEFNKFVEALPPASWSAGKFRTEYKLA